MRSAAATGDSPCNGTKFRESCIWIQDRDAGRIVHVNRMAQRGRPRGGLRHGGRRKGVLQPQRMPHFMHGRHEKRLVVTGTGLQREVPVQMHGGSPDRHKRVYARRCDGSGERRGTAIAEEPGGQILEHDVAARRILRRCDVFQAAEGNAQIGGAHGIPGHRCLTQLADNRIEGVRGAVGRRAVFGNEEGHRFVRQGRQIELFRRVHAVEIVDEMVVRECRDRTERNGGNHRAEKECSLHFVNPILPEICRTRPLRSESFMLTG